MFRCGWNENNTTKKLYTIQKVQNVCAEPPKVEEPERWNERMLSTLELSIHTQNKNPVQTVSKKINNYTIAATTTDSGC